MNASRENEATRVTKERLDATCRTRDTSLRLAWIVAIGQLLLWGVLAFALLDYWLMLPMPLRTAGALALIALAIWGAYRLVRLCRQLTALKQAALELEARHAELGCEISTLTEYLSGERKLVHEYEPELVAALETKAAHKLSLTPLDVGKKLVPRLAGLVAAALPFLVLLLIVPQGITALKRAVVPFSKTPYTEVHVSPGNVEIPVGSMLTVTNVFAGRAPKQAHLLWRGSADPGWQKVLLSKSTNGTYEHVFSDVRSDLQYKVAANDAVSDEYNIHTYVPPAVKELNIRISYPAYTKSEPTVQKSPDITAVRASTAELRVEPSVALNKAKLRFSGLPELALAPAADGSWSGAVKITKDTDYWIELDDQSGHRGVNDKPYHIKALPDKPPSVEVAEPGKDIRASPTNKVPVKVSVTDDFGVSEMKLIFHKLGGVEQTLQLTPASAHNGEVVGQTELDLAALGMKDYELVAYHAEATDNNTLDGPGIGRSPVYFIETSDEAVGQCLSQSQNQRVNLLVIQKQIIADTTALAPNASATNFQELTARQRDAADFGRMYLEAISGGDASAAAGEMQQAIKDMDSAAEHLAKNNRAAALPPEENALAHLYQTLKLLPELENLPTTPNPNQSQPPPPAVQVVLEAIKKKQKERPNNKEIEEAMEEAKNLARSQSGINSTMRRQASEGANEGQSRQAAGSKNSQATESSSPGSSQAGNNNSQAEKDDSQGQAGTSRDALAEKENQLSRRTAELAEKLRRQAGKDARLGHNLGQTANRAASQMAAAGQALQQGNAKTAGEQGFQGELGLRSVAAKLERLLKDQPDPSDIAGEDFPKEYESLISEYLKKLSHAE